MKDEDNFVKTIKNYKILKLISNENEIKVWEEDKILERRNINKNNTVNTENEIWKLRNI